jgi:hypothetical protein
MDADHGTAWSKGGTTDPTNCEMLCIMHNRAEGDKGSLVGAGVTEGEGNSIAGGTRRGVVSAHAARRAYGRGVAGRRLGLWLASSPG